MAEIQGSFYKGTSTVPDNPTVFTRYEKGQALSHAEMDTNLTSLLHTCSISETSSIKEAQYVTLEYASQSLVDGQEPSIVRDPITFQNIPSSDDVRYKLANEEIPGNLGVSENLHVTGTANFDGDVLIKGKLIVHDFVYENENRYNSYPDSVYSDRRLKKNIAIISGSLEKLNSISPVQFEWKDESGRSGQDIGLIAQEVQCICPEAVSEDSKGYLKIDYIKLIPLLINAIQELQHEKSIRNK